jgi:hypothetical protein
MVEVVDAAGQAGTYDQLVDVATDAVAQADIYAQRN